MYLRAECLKQTKPSCSDLYTKGKAVLLPDDLLMLPEIYSRWNMIKTSRSLIHNHVA